MKLRVQILLVLLLFGLFPLAAVLVINIPLIFNSLELYYHKAHLQNLRADFRDLDQQIASRIEMVRLLAKLPEADALVGDKATGDAAGLHVIQDHYADAVNRILYEQHDIVQVLFLDVDGKPRFWLERDADTLQLTRHPTLLDVPEPSFFQSGLRLEPGGVLVSPVSVNPEAGAQDPRRFMVLRLISPLGFARASGADPGAAPTPAGAVVISIDVGGLAEAYPKTYWVLSDGSFLRYGGRAGPEAAAFQEFPGLDEVFRRGELALWRGPSNEHVIWVPILATERSGPLWVGRQVDASPLSGFRHALQLRLVLVILPLIVVIVLVARWFAGRAERFGQELTEGIGRLLRKDEPVRFAWTGARELQALAEDLTRLAESHVAKSQALRDRARELEESNRYKSEFLANVSHELRTPLNSILLLSKLLAEGGGQGAPAERARQAQVVHEAGRDLAALIDNILDLARIEARKTALTVERADLRQLVQGVVDLVRPQADVKGLALTLEVEPDAPAILVSDTDKLRQILKNFLANAVKFTDRGGVRVVLGRNRGADALERPVRIAVADTGIGIPPDKHQVIFEAFRQADGSTNRRYGGSGLGLAISRGLAEVLGGRIELESREGAGAEFSLLLPVEIEPGSLGSEPGGPGLTRVVPEQPPAIPPADFGGRRVLIVDNDVRGLLAMTPLLGRWGLDVLAAGDGQEALETLHDEEGVDLVIVDLMLPGLGGNATIRRIREQVQSRRLPIVAIGTRCGAQARQEALEAGADELLCKPLEPGLLRDALAQLLPTQRAQPLAASFSS